MLHFKTFIAVLLTLLVSSAAYAAGDTPVMHVSPTDPLALACIGIFVLAYLIVILEEKTHIKKSKPVMLGAGLIWILIALMAPRYNTDHDAIHRAVMHGTEEYAALLLFLLTAMTYISTLQERNVFDVIRIKLIRAGFSTRQLFWVTGLLAFFLSPIADNLTTALVAGAIVLAVGGHDAKFTALACVNVVNAANAGGAFSPFGDITTLMVWQAGHVEFFEFFSLFIPSVVCFLVPAVIMHFFVPHHKPERQHMHASMKPGAKRIIFLGITTIAMAVAFEQVLGLPAFLGMMTGLGLLMMMAWYLKHHDKKAEKDFDIMKLIALAEWDTLLFFFGIIFCVSGLAYIGYLELASTALYGTYGPTVANIAVGGLSAVIDNIPVMFAVLQMHPEMSHFQWLLITLTAGVGGSLLSIGSAAGVALMGLAHKHYTFMSHLKWTPVLLLGFIAAIAAHFLVNSHMN